jgi:hypothetical protein
MAKFKINFFKKKKELISYEKYQRKIDELQIKIDELQYFKDSNTGLWVTDRPDLIQDPEKVMYQI